MTDKAEEYYGQYRGRLILQPLSDGRLMQVVEPFIFINKDEREWPVPVGTKVDGASIPQPLWSLIGAPFVGKYRDASVVHDYYCDVRSRPCLEVHRVFYNAMRVSSVSKYRAKLMYAAVYFAGPRWPDTTVHNVNLPTDEFPNVLNYTYSSPFEIGVLHAVDFDGETAGDFIKSGKGFAPSEGEMHLNLENIERIIESEDPSLADIEKALDGATKVFEPLRDSDDNDRTRTLIGVPSLLKG